MNRLILIELRRSSFRFCAPLLALAGFLVGSLNSFPSVASWLNLTDALITVSHFLVPFVAGIAAWEALRSSRRNIDSLENTAAISAPLARTPQVASSLAWVALTWLVVAAALAIRITLIGLYGVPDLSVMALAFVLPIAATVVGMSISHVIRRWVAVPISVALVTTAYGFTFIGGIPSFLRWTNVFGRFISLDGTVPNVAYFSALTAIAIATGALFAVGALIFYPPYRSTAIGLGILLVSVLIAGGGVAIGQRGQSNVVVESSRLSMETFQSDKGVVTITAKMLDHYTPVANEILDKWSRVASLFAETDLAFSHLEQAVDNDHLDAPHQFGRLYLNPWSNQIATDSVQMALYDVMSCYRDGGTQSGSFGLEGTIAVESWLLGGSFLNNAWSENPQVFEALAWLRSLTLPEAQGWVSRHVQNIRDCTWSARDFSST